MTVKIKHRIAGALAFIIGAIAMHFFLCYAVDAIQATTLKARSKAQFRQYKGNIKHLVMGDSHMARGIDPRVLGDSFNYATLGEPYSDTYNKLKSILGSKSKKPEIVFLPLDLHSFSSMRAGRKKNKKTAGFEKFLKDAFPYAGKEEIVLEYFSGGRDVKSELVLGFIPGEGDFSALTPEERDKAAKDRAAGHFKPPKVPFEPEFAEYLGKIIELCAKNDIKPVLVKMPVTGLYIEHSSEWFSIEDYEKDVDKILSAHPRAVILDYRNAFSERYDLFKDSDHLNTKGAEELTLMIKKDLQGLN